MANAEQVFKEIGARIDKFAELAEKWGKKTREDLKDQASGAKTEFETRRDAFEEDFKRFKEENKDNWEKIEDQAHQLKDRVNASIEEAIRWFKAPGSSQDDDTDKE